MERAALPRALTMTFEKFIPAKRRRRIRPAVHPPTVALPPQPEGGPCACGNVAWTGGGCLVCLGRVPAGGLCDKCRQYKRIPGNLTCARCCY